ncbi:Germacradien-4-ol synthase [Kitasatospora sp. MMS16-BH015]|uniref:terpene synthase family protein n=1 Tax=Kitasatospora sp. MMS16-BH015 TaxID=2018025 RepID=UPI000CA23763|nr:terpene cyclase [Kitasatospora sp. MMS16-BH015]AUG81268.1 Germacradien-4-ol synthase [Kitasatospora sp. MMS16-BH015]
MSDETTLELPFAHRRSPHHAQAVEHHRDWLHRHRDLAAGTADQAYAHWEIAELAALSYPDASAADLGLAADLLGFYFLFDDQFDGPLGRRPEQIARLCDRLGGILHGARPDGTSPVERAFADLWRRSQQGMPARWRARTAYDWEWYFASHAAEAAGRNSGLLPDRQGYLMLRRGTAAMETVFDMIERLGRFEVPQAVLHHPVLRQLRQLAADIPSFTNDVRSFPLEAPRGDVCNLVLIAQRERGCSVEEACAVVLDEAQLMADRFVKLAAELPDAYTWLELTPEERTAAQRYADGLAHWLAGYLHWERHTGRYHTP